MNGAIRIGFLIYPKREIDSIGRGSLCAHIFAERQRRCARHDLLSFCSIAFARWAIYRAKQVKPSAQHEDTTVSVSTNSEQKKVQLQDVFF